MSVEEIFRAARANKQDRNREVLGKESGARFLYNLGGLNEYRLENDNVVYCTGDLPKEALHFRRRAKGCCAVIRSIHRAKFNLHIDGTDNLIYLGTSQKFNGRVVIEGERNLFLFGDQSTSEQSAHFIGGSDKSVIFGTDCMVSSSVAVHNHDGHAVIDLDTRAVMNQPASVLVHPHVWLADGATVMKGVTIEAGAIVTANATVISDVPARSMVMGCPAQLIESSKGKVSWTRNPQPSEQDIKDAAALAGGEGLKGTMLDQFFRRQAAGFDDGA